MHGSKGNRILAMLECIVNVIKYITKRREREMRALVLSIMMNGKAKKFIKEMQK